MPSNTILTKNIALPRPPVVPNNLKSPGDLRTWLEQNLVPFLHNFLRASETDANDIHDHVNELTDKGGTLLSSQTLVLTRRTHCVSGANIVQKLEFDPGFRGFVFLVSLDGFETAVVAPPAGNIALAVKTTPGELVPFLFDFDTGLWHPTSGQRQGRSAPLPLVETLQCLGDYVETSTLIPAGVMAFNVRTSVKRPVLGCTFFQVGVESTTDAWGVSSVDQDAQNDRATYVWKNPAWHAERLPIRLTFPTPATSGEVDIFLFYEDYSI